MGGFINSGDCGPWSTSPDISSYLGEDQHQIPVVVHAISGSDGNTNWVDDEHIQAAIDHLNQAFAGALCPPDFACMVNSKISFTLVAIERTADDAYTTWELCSNGQLAGFPPNAKEFMENHQWDPLLHFNVYIVDLKAFNCSVQQQDNIIGISTFPFTAFETSYDGVAVDYSMIGSVINTPSHGNVLAHETGHYLGLYHTFEGGCSDPNEDGCYSSGDLLCDTNPEANPPGQQCSSESFSCGDFSRADNVHNFMSYRYLGCIDRFTPQQIGRMRCTLANWRPTLGKTPEFTASPVSGSEDGASVGIAWAPLYGSVPEKPALYLAREGQPNLVYQNAGGILNQVSDPVLEDPNLGWGVGATDLNSDGVADLYVGNVNIYNTPGDDLLALSNQSSGYFPVTPLDPANSESYAVAMADVDGDGDVDLVVAGYPCARLYLNDGSGAFTEISPSPFESLGFVLGATFGDYDDDGDQDLCLFGDASYVMLWQNTGGVFSQVNSFPVFIPSSAAWQDYDNDGDLDLFITSSDIYDSNSYFTNIGNGFFDDSSEAFRANWTFASQDAAWGDYDNDGDLDYYLTNRTTYQLGGGSTGSTGRNVLVENMGGGVFQEATTVWDYGDSRGCAWADYDADGDLDLVVAEYDGASTILENTVGSTSNYLEIELVGQSPNTMAIGARVDAVVPSLDLNMRRDVTSGRGMGNQDSHVVHFGLATATSADITVHWPDGAVSQLMEVAANQLLTIREHPFALVDQSSQSNIDTQGHQPYSSIAFDYDEGDGSSSHKPDLAISLIGYPGQIYQNTSQFGQASNFTLKSQLPGFFPAGEKPDDLRGLAAADVDNDGDLDFFGASASQPRLYINQGGDSPRFVDEGAVAGLTALCGDSWSGSWGDYNRDGWIDLYVTRAGGPAHPDSLTALGDVLLKNRTGETSAHTLLFSSAAQEAGLDIRDSRSTCASWGDANGDGLVDLVVGFLGTTWGQGFKTSPLYINDGDGTFTNVTGSGGSPTFSGLGFITSVAWADVDGDGFEDLALGRWIPPIDQPEKQDKLIVYRNDGAGGFSSANKIEVGGRTAPAIRCLEPGDFDLDGATDLLTVPVDPSLSPTLMVNDLAATGQMLSQASATEFTPGQTQGVVVADFNQDGDLDVYLGKAETTGTFFQNRQPNGAEDPSLHFVQVALRSRSNGNNRAGIGATVQLSLAGKSYVQIVDGGNGRGGQSPSTLTFGLGDGTGVATVEVSWPDGYASAPVTVSVPASGVVLVEDDHDPQLDDATVTMLPLTRPGGLVDWQFQWRTGYSSDKAQDKVRILSSSCSGTAVLSPGDPKVEHSVTAGADGYTHILTWRDQSCTPGCTLSYTVESAVSTPGHSPQASSTHTKKIKTCVQ